MNPKEEQQKPTVLVAEDNASNYKLFEAVLSRGYDLRHAWNGQEAVTMFAQVKPKAVLMDVAMPVMDGYEATREIRAVNADVPIIGLTAHAFFEDEKKCYAAGMTEYMVKPINIALLRKRLAEYVAGYSK